MVVDECFTLPKLSLPDTLPEIVLEVDGMAFG